MTNLNVGVFGAAGKMGSTVCQAINNDDSTNLTFAVDTNGVGTEIANTSLEIKDAVDTLEGTDVIVDFTIADAAINNLKFVAECGVHAVVGTSGLTELDMAEGIMIELYKK